jgi:hypothetical protein
MLLTIRSSVSTPENSPVKFKNYIDDSLREQLRKSTLLSVRSVHFSGKKPDHVFFLSCNIAPYHFVGSTYTNVLHLCNPTTLYDIPSTGQPIQYDNYLQFIEIELQDLSLKTLSLPATTETLVVLELKIV